MIRVFFIFIILLASVWLGIQLNRDPGYLLIAINHWTIETTLWFAILAVVFAFILLHMFLVLLSKITHIPGTYQTWLAKRRAQKAQATTRRGLIEFSEGYWSEAKNHLIKALPDTDTPLLNYLTAARAAQEMGDSQLRDDYLREAQQSMPEAKIAVELTQAQLQLANKQWEQALATLRHLHDLAPKHPYVLKLLTHLYQEVRDWPQLIALLPELKKTKIVTGAAFDQLLHHTYLHALSDLIRHNQADAITQLIDNLPKTLKHDPDIMVEYCRYLAQKKKLEQAESILRHSLRKNYSDKLITLYGQIHYHENQLTFAETLLKKQPDSPELLLCLGRLSLNNHLWGKAKSYFEKSIELRPSPEVFQELGKLLETLNDQNGACRAYHQGLVIKNQKS
ncbi:heme biosynthesis HemY N-terminal domain-containing protein [Legionella spiritensis]|uniref:Protoporphyrinogen oxidase n=1 Tax=Legionella spiritensis TaxID=452 RepID=A0A0W0Z5E0_LEGSP|nr:heme biosynthesis HemY N-terminal domain-containing protein [Legionella spiritensis]KTD64347.1 protoporphyrinogen oxidase [Legionella spiritensis]SNV46424.1 HemY protein [Legionella spiritensis]VEG91088.1 HemY protein [Legionella spiritensis]